MGHSFLPEDDVVVRAFLDFLTTLQGSLPSFMWEHAQSAEPNTITDKVLRIAKDKNLFIGICTVKESAVLNGALIGPRWPDRRHLRIPINQVAQKTSDWIIQEIGMAIGMNMKTIILQEKGIRLPGGLQGNTEYIPFERSRPSDAFPALVQMISSLSPQEQPTTLPATAEAKVDESVEQPAQPTVEFDSASPDNTWGESAYEFAIFKAASRKDKEIFERIDAAYRKTQFAASSDEVVAWDAHKAWARIRFGFEGNLQSLKDIVKNNPRNSRALESLARAYSFYKEHNYAASTYLQAAKVADDASSVEGLFERSVEQYVADRKYEMAFIVAEDLRKMIDSNPDTELGYLRALIHIAAAQKDDELHATALERITELQPNDVGHRFLPALKQSELGNNDLALSEYSRVPDREKVPGIWNNLGVQFDHFDLGAKAVGAFTEAANQDETLAMSNLGYRLANHGFLSLAKEYAERATTKKDCNKNVYELLARINEIPEEEQRRESEILEGAQKKSEFYREMGRAISRPNGNDSATRNRWVDESCLLKGELSGDEITLVGWYEREQPAYNGLLALVAGTPVPPAPPQKVKRSIKYTGRFVGGAFFGSVARSNDGSNSLLSGSNTEVRVFSYLAPDNSALHVMEMPTGRAPSFHAIPRAAAA